MWQTETTDTGVYVTFAKDIKSIMELGFDFDQAMQIMKLYLDWCKTHELGARERAKTDSSFLKAFRADNGNLP